MKNQTFDLDDYISQRKERDSDFANGFDTGYEEFKIGIMIKFEGVLYGRIICDY